MKRAVIWLWISFAALFVVVLLLGFIQNPALQSAVSLGFFVLGIPLLLVALGMSMALLIIVILRKSSRGNGGSRSSKETGVDQL